MEIHRTAVVDTKVVLDIETIGKLPQRQRHAPNHFESTIFQFEDSMTIVRAPGSDQYSGLAARGRSRFRSNGLPAATGLRFNYVIPPIFRVDRFSKGEDPLACDWADLVATKVASGTMFQSERWSNPQVAEDIERELIDLGFGQ